MPTGQYSMSVQIGAISVSKAINRTGNHPNEYSVDLAAAPAGTLTTRTDNSTGTLTMSSGGHGIATGNIIDLYWSGGRRYKVTVGTVSGTSVPISVGSGDNLPIATTAVVACVRTNVNTAIDGDNSQLLVISAEFSDTSETSKCQASFFDVGDALIAHMDLTANQPQVYDLAAGVTNPFTGNPITYARVSNGSSAGTCTLKIASLENA